MTQVRSQQISSIKLRNPSKQSYLVIYYTFYLIKISIFLFFNYFSLFTRKYYSLFFLFFHCLLPRDPDNRKKKEKPTATIVHCMSAITQPKLFFTTFSHVTLTKERKKRNPQPQLLLCECC